MDFFNSHNNELHAEKVPLTDIASHYGTPCYIYSRATLERHWHAFDDALQNYPHLICYAVKANSNLAVLNLFAQLGSGFDIVSQGELERVLAAGGEPDKIVFSGVGKRISEIERALEVGIHCFNVESPAELFRIQEVAKHHEVPAPISIRVNPDVDAKTHPYISTGLKEDKFGIPSAEALNVYQQATDLSHLSIMGIDCHIGSQLLELDPLLDALNHLLALIDQLNTVGIELNHINLGGGLGVRYQDEEPPHPKAYVEKILPALQKTKLSLILEPGRSIAANAGILLMRVEYLKSSNHKNFAITDAAMNDLLRPALYNAKQTIVPVLEHSRTERKIYDIVGPVCETGDFLAKECELAILEGDLLAIRGAGAYGFSMSSNYNSRPRAAEVLVDGDQHHLVRERETLARLFDNEKLIAQ